MRPAALTAWAPGGASGHRAQLVPLGAGHAGQGMRTGGAVLLARQAVALLEPRDLPGVEPIHLVTSRGQGLHPQPSVSLDRHHNLARITVPAQVHGDQLMHRYRELDVAAIVTQLVLSGFSVRTPAAFERFRALRKQLDRAY